MNKPDLIVISQNLLGGGTSFNNNMLSHFPKDYFNIKCIYLDPIGFQGTKALDIQLGPNDILFPYGQESPKVMAERMSKFLTDAEGAIVSNLETELICLDIIPKPNKTVYFICHDDGFINIAVKYSSLIDVFIAHNISVYNELKTLLPKREKEIFFIQHGVRIPVFEKKINEDQKLKLVFLARHYEYKGLYDLPEINDLLVQNDVHVEWMILGNGPERNKFINQVKHMPNFQFQIPQTAEDVLSVLKQQDVFILPSRKDGLPVALLESMSVGCVPIIANFSEGIKRVVTEDVGFVIPVGDNVLFSKKIIELSGNRNLLKLMSVNSVKKIKNDFDIEKQALEYYNLYLDYKKFKKKHYTGLKDVKRKLNYNSTYSKLAHLVSTLKARIITKSS
jgi:glycosyltransferase involved in cell wall biosynthesis